MAGASKSAQPVEAQTPEEMIRSTPLFFGLQKFILNSSDISSTTEATVAAYGDDPDTLTAELAKLRRRPTADYLDGYRATVTVIKANEAVLSGKRIEFKPEWYELA